MAESSGPILHVIVIGFHHKKGCQVEYSFPPLVAGAPNECPLGWKYLPTLALPDGSHNYDEDTVYFHLPSLSNPKRTIYGISCFRQIPVEKLKNRTSDITRGTVQKSVCVLSTLPLYGHIQVKMALITHAYFEEGDFSKVSLLEDTYHHLNSCMTSESQIPPQVFVGLSARDFILQFRHKVLLLFKLLLLEKRIVFYQSPVQPLCAAILTLLSLYPGMIEHGLQQAACVRPSRPMSPIPIFDDDDDDGDDDRDHDADDDADDDNDDDNDEYPVNSADLNINKDINKGDRNISEANNENSNNCKDENSGDDNSNRNSLCINDNKTLETMEGKCMDEFRNLTVHKTIESKTQKAEKSKTQQKEALQKVRKNNNENDNLNIEMESGQECTESFGEDRSDNGYQKGNDNVHRVQSVNTITLGTGTAGDSGGENDGENGGDSGGDNGDNNDDNNGDNALPRDTSNDALSDARLTNNITQIAHVNPELCGLPLNLFTKGYLCLPYLSLPYLDLLADVNVRGYIVGATNILFKQKKQLIDVLVEVENTRIEATDPDLRRQLHLTTEDLRFADYIVRHVSEPRKDIFLDGVGWEGGDEWIRTQFRVYLLSMLRTTLQQDSRQSDHYNSAFIAAWRMTNNYKMWSNTHKPEINSIESGHPFAGQLSVQDMKLRLSHTMQNSESGRKLNQAMASTGRAVATTGKAVGGALSQAKGAFSSWWSTLTTVQPIVDECKSEGQQCANQATQLANDKNANEKALIEKNSSEKSVTVRENSLEKTSTEDEKMNVPSNADLRLTIE